MLNGLVDTKKECIEFLQDTLAVPIAERIYVMYLECQKKGLKQFQIELSKIAKWNNHTIEDEARQIIEKSGCSYLQKILKTTITTCVKIKFSEYKKKLNHIKMKIPDVLDFIHKCFINTANYAWKHTYLFVQSNIRQIEIQNNMNIFEHNTRKAISKTITEYIIVEDIFDQLNEMIDKMNKKKKVISKPKPDNYELPNEPIDDNNDNSEQGDEDIGKFEQDIETDVTIKEDDMSNGDVSNEYNESNESNEGDIVDSLNEDISCEGIKCEDGTERDDVEEHDDEFIEDNEDVEARDDEACKDGDHEDELISDSMLDNKNEYSVGFKSDSESDEDISDSESIESEKSLNNNEIKVVKINDAKPKKLSFF